jgi:ribosomal-protein-alanine N-acetyltransferase
MTDSGEYKIRPAEALDVDGIMELEKGSIAHPWQREEISKLITEDNKFALVTDKDGHVVCYIGCDIVLDEADIGNLVTDVNERGKGLATMLMSELLERLKDKGVKKVFLEVESTNLPAIRVYEKCGFARSGLRKAYYGEGRDAILMDCEI